VVLNSSLFKARPMPNFKAMHNKIQPMSRTVHTPVLKRSSLLDKENMNSGNTNAQNSKGESQQIHSGGSNDKKACRRTSSFASSTANATIPQIQQNAVSIKKRQNSILEFARKQLESSHSQLQPQNFPKTTTNLRQCETIVATKRASLNPFSACQGDDDEY
jgi:hypothetical protein